MYYTSRVENKSEIQKQVYSFIWNLRVTGPELFWKHGSYFEAALSKKKKLWKKMNVKAQIVQK